MWVHLFFMRSIRAAANKKKHSRNIFFRLIQIIWIVEVNKCSRFFHERSLRLDFEINHVFDASSEYMSRFSIVY